MPVQNGPAPRPILGYAMSGIMYEAKTGKTLQVLITKRLMKFQNQSSHPVLPTRLTTHVDIAFRPSMMRVSVYKHLCLSSAIRERISANLAKWVGLSSYSFWPFQVLMAMKTVRCMLALTQTPLATRKVGGLSGKEHEREIKHSTKIVTILISTMSENPTFN